MTGLISIMTQSKVKKTVQKSCVGMAGLSLLFLAVSLVSPKQVLALSPETAMEKGVFNYSVQVGAFASKENAVNNALYLQNKGLDAFVVYYQDDQKRRLFSVSSGAYETYAQALEAEKSLKNSQNSQAFAYEIDPYSIKQALVPLPNNTILNQQTATLKPPQSSQVYTYTQPRQAPIGQAPIGQAPIGQAPIGQAPVWQAPIGQAPIGQAPTQKTPIQKTPIQNMQRVDIQPHEQRAMDRAETDISQAVELNASRTLASRENVDVGLDAANYDSVETYDSTEEMGSTGVSEKGWYLLGSVGQARLNLTASELNDRLSSSTSSQISVSTEMDYNTIAWKLVGGYRFSRYLGIEVGYVNLNKRSATVNFSSSAPVDALERVSENLPSLLVQGGILEGVASVEVVNNLSVLAKAGGIVWHGGTVFSSESGSLTERDDYDVDLALGLGAHYQITDNIGFRMEWERFFLDDSIDLWTGGVELRN